MFHAFMTVNKRSLWWSASNESRALDQLRRAVDWADIVITSLDHIFPDAHEMVAEAVRLSPGPRAWVDVLPFGEADQPRGSWQMEDLLYQAAGGLIMLNGAPDREPLRLNGNQTAFLSGVHAAGAALISHYAATTEQRLIEVQQSVDAVIMHTLQAAIQFYTTAGVISSRHGGHVGPGDGVFPCSDGFVAVTAFTYEGWASLIRWLTAEGMPEIEEMAKWTHEERRLRENRERFDAIFERFLAQYTREELVARGKPHDAFVSSVKTLEEVTLDPQLNFESWFKWLPFPGLDTLVRWPGAPYRISGLATSVRQPVPDDGEHSEIFWENIGAMK